MRVLIAGGGIGGLTAALSCHHFGHEVVVFEQAQALENIGAGIQLPPNAMKVLHALGLEDLISETAFDPQAIQARMGKSGRSIFSIPLASCAAQNWGAPYLHMHRADYIQTLSGALASRAPKALRLGESVKRYKNQDGGVVVALNDGRELSGDVLIAADGIKSSLREQMLGPNTPRFTGNAAWRAVVPLDDLGAHAPEPTACVWMGSGRHAVSYRVRGGRFANFVGVVERTDWTAESWTEKGSQEQALKDFEGWHPVITALIKAVKPEQLYCWALYDRAPLEKWSDGYVALLGDAAHPMLPFLAQGAAMAIEDSWVLARELSRETRPAPESLVAYQALRFNRTRKAQLKSRANMKTFHRRTALGKLAAYGPMWMAGKFAPTIIYKKMDWLYSHDVTKDHSA